MQGKTRNTRWNKTQKKPLGVITVGLVYANWCGHCKALKPEWKIMKNSIMKTPSFKNGMYKFIEIEDSDKQKDSKMNNVNKHISGEKLAVNGYPTVFKVKGGKVEYFQGEQRTAPYLKSWFTGSNEPMKKEHEQIHNNEPFLNRFFGGKTRKNKSRKNK